MSNAPFARQLQQLRAEVAEGRVTIDEVYDAFERLTHELADLRPGDDQRLRDLVNDVELVRFTRLPENQPAAAGEVLEQAQRLFDELAERSR